MVEDGTRHRAAARTHPHLAPLRAPGQAGNVCTSPLLSLQSKSYLNQITKYPDAVLLMPPFVCSVFASFAFLHHFSRELCPFFPAHLRCWFRFHTFEGDSNIDNLESTNFFSGSLSFIGSCSYHTSANNFCNDSVGVWKYEPLIHSLPGGWLHDCCTPTPAPATLPNPIPTQQRRSLGHFLTDIGEILENWKLIVWKQEQSWTSMVLRNASAAAACTSECSFGLTSHSNIDRKTSVWISGRGGWGDSSYEAPLTW